MQAPKPARIELELLELPYPSPALHWDMEGVDFLSERIAVQSKQLGRLNLIALGFLQGLRNQWSFNGGNQHGMKIAPGTVAHAFDEISHLPFHIVLKTQGRRRA